LYGARPRPFSITLVFPDLDVPQFAEALALARASAEYREVGAGADRRYRARFWPKDAAGSAISSTSSATPTRPKVLIDDRPVPYARDLWLPLVWFLIPR
jgi:hypothetical protein